MKQIFLICEKCKMTEDFYFKFPHRPEIIKSNHLFCVDCSSVIFTGDTAKEPRFYQRQKKERK